MVASSLVMRPVFENLFLSPSRAPDNREFKRMIDQQYQLNTIRGTVPSSTATAYAVRNDDPTSCNAASSTSGSRDVYVPGAGLDSLQSGKIKIQTAWEISTAV